MPENADDNNNKQSIDNILGAIQRFQGGYLGILVPHSPGASKYQSSKIGPSLNIDLFLRPALEQIELSRGTLCGRCYTLEARGSLGSRNPHAVKVSHVVALDARSEQDLELCTSSSDGLAREDHKGTWVY